MFLNIPEGMFLNFQLEFRSIDFLSYIYIGVKVENEYIEILDRN